MDWDSDSRFLAIGSSTSNGICLFNFQLREATPLKAPFVPTWISFVRSGSAIAAGSDKGKFWICDRQTQQGQTFQGTHIERITDGWWNTKNQLALCSADRSVSMGGIGGEVIARRELEDTASFPHYVCVRDSLALIFSAQDRPIIYIWEFANGDRLMEIPFSRDVRKVVKCFTLSVNLI
jgi:WD repeat-containing protein 19